MDTIQNFKVVIVEGLIAAGKSTFSDEIGIELEIVSGKPTLVLQEPDEQGGANPYLADYYANPARWALTMQLHLLHARFKMQLHAQFYAMSGYGHAVLDRSFYGDTSFARLQYHDSYMTKQEYETYLKCYESMTCFVRFPTACIRLLITPEEALQRLQKRAETRDGRKSELTIPISYMQGLDREISVVTDELRLAGTRIYEVSWEENRQTPEDRKRSVHALAARIHGLTEPDPMISLHRRTFP